MPRIYRKRTDIPIPEPRHRVGPKGVSSGISFRNLPPPSLDEIKKICEHYQIKCAGTYKSLASRYLYQMANEIDILVDALKVSGFPGEEHDRYFDAISAEVDGLLSKKMRATSSHAERGSQEMRNVRFDPRSMRSNRPQTAHPNRNMMVGEFSDAPSPPTNSKRLNSRKQQCNSDSERQNVDPRRLNEKAIRSQRKPDSLAYLDFDSESEKILRSIKEDLRRPPRGRVDSLAYFNLEDQNEEVLRWLKEEIKRSQSLIDRSRYMHDAELVNAQNELKRVKRAAKLLVKAVHKKGKEKAAKSEANAEMERLRRLQSQKMIESLIQSHSAQIDLLKKGLRVGSPDNASDRERLYPWGEVQDDTTDFSLGFTESSGLTSILDDLAEESFRRSKVAENP